MGYGRDAGPDYGDLPPGVGNSPGPKRFFPRPPGDGEPGDVFLYVLPLGTFALARSDVRRGYETRSVYWTAAIAEAIKASLYTAAYFYLR